MNENEKTLKSDLNYLTDKRQRFESYKKELREKGTKIRQRLKAGKILRISVPLLGLLLFKMNYGIVYNGLVYLICVGAIEIYITHKEEIDKSNLLILDVEMKENNADIYKNVKEINIIKQKLSRIKTEDKEIVPSQNKNADFAPLEIDFSRARRFKH